MTKTAGPILQSLEKEDVLSASVPSLDERVAQTREENRRAVDVAERRASEFEDSVKRSMERIQRALETLDRAGFKSRSKSERSGDFEESIRQSIEGIERMLRSLDRTGRRKKS